MADIYLDCSMGCAGDMFAATLLDAMPEGDREAAIDKLNSLEIPSVRFCALHEARCGIGGTYLRVEVDGHLEGEGDCCYSNEQSGAHHYRGHHHESDNEKPHVAHDHHHVHLSDVWGIIDGLDLGQKVKSDAKEVFALIAEAEAEVHGAPVDQLHFHEVGTMDAIADVVAGCYLVNLLDAGRISSSPVHVGSGTVKCAHGTLPVPAPATALLLEGIPIYGGDVQGELCTPTGAALLKYFVSSFDGMPKMKVSSVGYGLGTKEFEQANVLRAMVGEFEAYDETASTVVELDCNIDDMTGEELGFALDHLIQDARVLDAWFTPIQMKKSRPATMLGVLCSEADVESVAARIFELTTTLGIRAAVRERYVLERTEEEVETPLGKIRRKVSEGYGVKRAKFEYDDISQLAEGESAK